MALKGASHKARGQKVRREGGRLENSIDLHGRHNQQWSFWWDSTTTHTQTHTHTLSSKCTTTTTCICLGSHNGRPVVNEPPPTPAEVVCRVPPPLQFNGASYIRGERKQPAPNKTGTERGNSVGTWEKHGRSVSWSSTMRFINGGCWQTENKTDRWKTAARARRRARGGSMWCDALFYTREQLGFYSQWGRKAIKTTKMTQRLDLSLGWSKRKGQFSFLLCMVDILGWTKVLVRVNRACRMAEKIPKPDPVIRIMVANVHFCKHGYVETS